MGHHQGHGRRHRHRGGSVPSDDLPAVPGRQGRPVRGPACAQPGGLLRRAARRRRGRRLPRGGHRAHGRRRHPRAARRRRPRRHAGVRARRRRRRPDRRRPAADHPLRHRVPHPARRSISRPRQVARADRRPVPPHHQLLPRAERHGRPRRPGVGARVPRAAARALPPVRPVRASLSQETDMSVTHRENDEIIGRADINDLEAILSVTNTDVDEVVHAVKDNADALFTWDYSLARPQLRKLYEKGKTGQWNASTDLPWDTAVDLEAVVSNDQIAMAAGLDPNHYDGTVLEKWGDKEWLDFGIQNRRWTLSQFLHGEQGALLCTAKITETVPWYDAKLYASTQVVDEARHVEVFARYLDEKLGGGYQVNAHLRMLLDDIINDSRWDMTYLGMQVMVEGLALAAFGFMHQMTEEPLLKQLLRYVMSDEARHVAFGVLSLKEAYEGMTDAELKDRQEFAYEAAVRMRDRFMSQEVWERMCVNTRDVVPLVLQDPTRQLFQSMLFSKIVPNCKKLGLLDRNGKWLRHRFEEMGVIQFEDLEDTGEEYIKFELGAEAPSPV